MLGAVFGSGGGFSLPGYLASSPHLILSGRSSESRGPIASPDGLGGTLSRIYGSMMGVQSEMYESCCRPCSPIIWGDMPQTHRDKPIAEKCRELRLPSRPLATLRWSLWTYQGSTLGRTRAAAVRSQRSHFSSSRRDSVTCAAFHTVTDRVGKAPLRTCRVRTRAGA